MPLAGVAKVPVPDYLTMLVYSVDGHDENAYRADEERDVSLGVVALLQALQDSLHLIVTAVARLSPG